MTRKAGLRLAAALAAALTAPRRARCARRAAARRRRLPRSGKTLRYVVWIDGPRLAAELARKNGAPTTRRIVFRSARTWCGSSTRSARPTTSSIRQSAKQAASQVAGLRQGLEQGLGSLTPEQRAAVQRPARRARRSRRRGPLPEYRLRERGELGRYAEIACARHDVLEGERAVAELCLADYGKPPLAARAPRRRARPRRLPAPHPRAAGRASSRACARSRPTPPSTPRRACRSTCAASTTTARPARPW